MRKDTTQKAERVSENEARQLEEQIRLRAYALYESRGREDGHDVDDWLLAEREVGEQTIRKMAA